MFCAMVHPRRWWCAFKLSAGFAFGQAQSPQPLSP
jgi:hypothetical protein